MKKFLFIIIISVIFFFSAPAIFAQSPTPTSTPTSEKVTEKLSDQITKLKEKIATRVAQLKLVEKRGIAGTVKEVTGTQLILTDVNGKNRLVDVDEITKFSSPSAKNSFGLSDLKPGTTISVIGIYNKDSKRLLARFIKAISLPMMVSGSISAIDKANFTITIAMEEGKKYLIDIETITRTTSYIDTEATKSGFSKLQNGDRVIVIGYVNKKEANRMVATRVLVFPDLPKNPNVIVAPDALETDDEIVTSTGSGKKLTPLR